MTERELAFPPGFLWGTASSAYQVEGGNTNNQWWLLEQRQGGAGIWNGDRCGLACDWWRHAEQDFDRMQQLHLNAHRLSVEWSRVEPAPSCFDRAALDRYRQMVGELRDRGITPMVNCHHFTNPIWLEVAGGWERPETVHRFQRYVHRLVSALADLHPIWLTINEPLVYLGQGWFRGIWPPFKRDPVAALRVYRHLLLAHAAAYHTIHALQPDALVGYAKARRLFTPSRAGHAGDRLAAWLRRYLFEELWQRATQTGRILPPVGLGEYRADLADSFDFVGINYYSRSLVRFTPRPWSLFGQETFTPGAETSDSGRRGPYSEFYPEGLYRLCLEARPLGKPIYVLENGLPDADDDQRPRWLLAHLLQMRRAMAAGCDVRGYFHWTFVDNFEWTEGWGLRFGLVALDPVTQERRARPSAYLYGDIARRNAIAREHVARHAPGLLPLFDALSTATG